MKRCGSAYEQPAENVFETTWSQDKRKAELTERVLSHARGNAVRNVVEAEEFNDSCKESESESSNSDGENTYVEESFEILFVPEEDIQHVN